jgi:hypothetical protein
MRSDSVRWVTLQPSATRANAGIGAYAAGWEHVWLTALLSMFAALSVVISLASAYAVSR